MSNSPIRQIRQFGHCNRSGPLRYPSDSFAATSLRRPRESSFPTTPPVPHCCARTSAPPSMRSSPSTQQLSSTFVQAGPTSMKSMAHGPGLFAGYRRPALFVLQCVAFPAASVRPVRLPRLNDFLPVPRRQRLQQGSIHRVPALRRCRQDLRSPHR